MSPRYQQGTVETAKTAAGETIYIRFSGPDGSRPRVRVGLRTEFKKKSDLDAALRRLRDSFNAGELAPAPVYTVGALIDRYEAEEMPERFSTACGYRKLHKVIRRRWEAVELKNIAPLEVRAWLRTETKLNGKPMASKYRGHVLAQFRNLFKYAMLWNWMPLQVNPLTLITLEGATKRTRMPRVVSPGDFRKLMEHFADRPRDGELMRALIVPAYCLGLRISELIGLRWEDIDYLGGVIHIRRGVVRGRTGKVKTERSEAPIPMPQEVGKAFLRWRDAAPYKGNEDWVFGSINKDGETPVDARALQSHKLRPAGAAIGLDFSLGWHTFRHSFKVLLERAGVDVTVQRDMMRHADVHTTQQIYGGAIEMDRMRDASTRAMQLAFETSERVQ